MQKIRGADGNDVHLRVGHYLPVIGNSFFVAKFFHCDSAVFFLRIAGRKKFGLYIQLRETLRELLIAARMKPPHPSQAD